MNAITRLFNATPATPASDAVAVHDAARNALAAERQALGVTDSAKMHDINMLTTIRDGLQGARSRRLDLLAAQGLGEDVAADLVTVEAAIRAGETDEALTTERAAIATRQRALLAPKLAALADRIKALDDSRPDLERAAEHEALVALLADYGKAQATFFELWLQVQSRALRMDRARVVSAPLGAASAVADLVLPLPHLHEAKAVELDRRVLFERLQTLAEVPASALNTR
jgi:hypothetical protein